MNNRTLIDKFKNQVVTLHAITISIVTFVEIVAYIVFVKQGKYELSWSCGYLWEGVIIPAIINIIAHFVARSLTVSKKVNSKISDHAIIYAAYVTTFVVSIAHRDYIITGCAFIFPILLTTMYNDFKFMKISLILSMLSVMTTGLVVFLEGKADVEYGLNFMVLCGFVAVSYYCSIASIRFSNSSFTLIENQEMQNDVLYEEIQKDSMTGLLNHKAFIKEQDNFFEKYHHHNESFCLAVIDIDDFKRVNDTYGHDCGDEVLIKLANIIKNHCSDDDKPCRYGGEEFTILFGNKSLSESEVVMNYILHDFRTAKYGFTSDTITFSCGLVQCSDTTAENGLFGLADQIMYNAKKSGKNQIKTH